MEEFNYLFRVLTLIAGGFACAAFKSTSVSLPPERKRVLFYVSLFDG